MEEDPKVIFQKRPLFGIPFTVKDNFDVAGYPTTAGCPDFAYTPWATSFAIKKLEDAGAVLMGKCNMDQFATGLVGVRSPYGTPVNPFNPAYCPGGSSRYNSCTCASVCIVSIAPDIMFNRCFDHIRSLRTPFAVPFWLIVTPLAAAVASQCPPVCAVLASARTLQVLVEFRLPSQTSSV